VTEPRTLPPRLPAQQPGDYRWSASGPTDDAHAFPPVDDGRLPGPAPCGARWNVRHAYEGGGKCATCVALLRDHLRAISVALAAAGIRTDLALDAALLATALARHGVALENVASIGDAEQWLEDRDFARNVATTYAELGAEQPHDDQRGDHFAGMDR
jgi:hypothetical protein